MPSSQLVIPGYIMQGNERCADLEGLGSPASEDLLPGLSWLYEFSVQV